MAMQLSHCERVVKRPIVESRKEFEASLHAISCGCNRLTTYTVTFLLRQINPSFTVYGDSTWEGGCKSADPQVMLMMQVQMM